MQATIELEAKSSGQTIPTTTATGLVPLEAETKELASASIFPRPQEWLPPTSFACVPSSGALGVRVLA